jgi:hypothetical protein
MPQLLYTENDGNRQQIYTESSFSGYAVCIPFSKLRRVLPAGDVDGVRPTGLTITNIFALGLIF